MNGNAPREVIMSRLKKILFISVIIVLTSARATAREGGAVFAPDQEGEITALSQSLRKLSHFSRLFRRDTGAVI